MSSTNLQHTEGVRELVELFIINVGGTIEIKPSQTSWNVREVIAADLAGFTKIEMCEMTAKERKSEVREISCIFQVQMNQVWKVLLGKRVSNVYKTK